MHALWATLRGYVHCGSKPGDVIQGGETPVRRRGCTERKISEDELSHHAHAIDCQTEEIIAQKVTRNWFYSLEIGDPSRNVIEMIFRATIADTPRRSTKVKQVLKLNNSIETLERFERFRDAVKRHYNTKHPRSMADGNEQLMFYGTTITCCSGKPSGESMLCKDLNCSICRVLQSGFKNTGIWLSTSCQDFIEDAIANANAGRKNVKRAIMVCRVIAGRVNKMLDRDYEGDYDCIGGVKSKYLFVKDPNAVLPCFVIILN